MGLRHGRADDGEGRVGDVLQSVGDGHRACCGTIVSGRGNEFRRTRQYVRLAENKLLGSPGAHSQKKSKRWSEGEVWKREGVDAVSRLVSYVFTPSAPLVAIEGLCTGCALALALEKMSGSRWRGVHPMILRIVKIQYTCSL